MRTPVFVIVTRLLQMTLVAVPGLITGCFSGPAMPRDVDGIAVTQAEREAVFRAQFYKPWIDHQTRDDAVRRVRESKEKRAGLTTELASAREYNQKLASYCEELLEEVDSLNGRPHATLDQKKDLLGQIARQMERASFASKQTEQALQKNRVVRAGLGSASTGGTKEAKAYDAEIERLEARRKQLSEAMDRLGRQRKEISS